MVRLLGKHEAVGPIAEIIHRPRILVSKQWIYGRWKKVWKDFVFAVVPDPSDRTKRLYVNCATDDIPWLERIPEGMKILHAPPDFKPREIHTEIKNPLPLDSRGVPMQGQHTSMQQWKQEKEEKKLGNWAARKSDEASSRRAWKQAPHDGQKTWPEQQWRSKDLESPSQQWWSKCWESPTQDERDWGNMSRASGHHSTTS